MHEAENQLQVAVDDVATVCTRPPHTPVTRLQTTPCSEIRSSAIAEGPRDASWQLKSCPLPHNSAETTCTTSPEPGVPGLSCGFVCVIQCLAVLAKHRLVTGRRTDTRL